MQRLRVGWRYKENLRADAGIARESEEEEEDGHGWAVEGQTAGGLDIQHKVALAAGAYGTQFLGEFNRGS